MLSQPPKTHLPSVAQLTLSIIGLVFSLFTVLVIWIATRISSLAQTMEFQNEPQINSVIWVLLIISLVSLPSIIFAILRLSRRPIKNDSTKNYFLITSYMFLLIIPAIYLISVKPEILRSPFLHSLLTILMVAIPVWWFVELGQNRLINGSPQRRWGLVNFSIFAGLPLVIFIELLTLLLVLILGSIWLTQQPEFKPLLMTFQTQLMLNPEDVSGLLNQISPLLQKPAALVAGFMLVVFLIPLIEEVLKPLALWFFIKREWLPSEGFTAGLICGASFAVVESIFSILSVPQESWGLTLIGRVGTGLLHTLTTGLSGWALVSSWRDGKYLRIGLTYLVSVSIHGVWNFFALLYGLGNNMPFLADPTLSGLAEFAPWILGMVFAGMLLVLFLMNRKIRSSIAPPQIPSFPTEITG